jgi:hypothetical protein
MQQFLIGLLISVGTPALLGIAGALMSKFMAAQKLANLLNRAFIALEKMLSVFGAKLGAKTSEDLDELLFGTIYMVLKYVGQAGIDRMHKQDKDGDFKDVPIIIIEEGTPINRDTDNSLGKDE